MVPDDEMLHHKRYKLFPSRRFHQILLVLIFFASIILMLLEVLYLQHIRRKGLLVSIFSVELILDVMILIDVVRRARKFTSCSQYMNNTWNWLDLLTLWIIVIHWIVAIHNPFVQIYSDAWVVLRYSLNSARIIYWMIRNVKHYKKENYKVIPNEAVGDMEWLPVSDLSEEQATNMLFDENDPWIPGKPMQPEILIQQFQAPNAVNANEAEKRENAIIEAEKKAAEVEETRRLAEEKQINDILGPETDEEDNKMGVEEEVDHPTTAGSFEEAAAAFEAATNEVEYDIEEDLEDKLKLYDDSYDDHGREVLNDETSRKTELLFTY